MNIETTTNITLSLSGENRNFLFINPYQITTDRVPFNGDIVVVGNNRLTKNQLIAYRYDTLYVTSVIYIDEIGIGTAAKHFLPNGTSVKIC